jgi:hypothetical protein
LRAISFASSMEPFGFSLIGIALPEQQLTPKSTDLRFPPRSAWTQRTSLTAANGRLFFASDLAGLFRWPKSAGLVTQLVEQRLGRP